MPTINAWGSQDPAQVAKGGTGSNSFTIYGPVVAASTTTGALTSLAAGSANQVLQSGGAAANPAWSTATFPSTATSTGTILRADGTNWSATTATFPNTTTLNQILYSSSANTVAGLATATNGVLITDATTGIPSISSTLPSAVQGNITSVGTISSGTWAGTTIAVNHGGTGQTTLTNHGVLVGAATSAITQLAAGSSGQVLQSGGASADPAYSTATYPATATSTGTILRADGTNWSATTATYPATTTANQILFSSANNVIGAISNGTTGQVLIATTSSAPSFGGTPLTINGDSGSAAASSSAVTFNAATNCGSSVSFSGTSATISLKVGDANNNVIIGPGAGTTGPSGSFNVALGENAAYSLGNASNNVFIGRDAGYYCTTGAQNVCIGGNAQFGSTFTAGAYNVCLGYSASTGYTGSESHNILINNNGTASESNTLHIGAATGTGTQQLNAAYICGIDGKTSASGVAVLINASNLLGTSTSSIRYKENVQDIGDNSSRIYDLRPVTYNYKVNLPHVDEIDSKLTQYGLIAEEAVDVMPELVMYNKDGQIETVRYLNLIPLLLNEIQNLNKRIEALETRF